MNKELCDKLNTLPIADRKRYKKELDLAFTDSVYAARNYNMSRDEYNDLSQETKEKFQEIIYIKMFGNSNK
jgi:hypothetical protein